MKNLISEIKTKLGIDGGVFIDAEIEDYIKGIDRADYLAFFKALSGEHNFSKPMDRVANVAKQFAKNKEQLVLAGTREQAKSMYDKFYAECCAMLDYCRANRESISSDREFFRNIDYAALKKADGTQAYSKQELYVLNELGGGEWLIEIRAYSTAKDAVDAIERVIKQGKITKYLSAVNAIESKRVSKMLRGVA